MISGGNYTVQINIPNALAAAVLSLMEVSVTDKIQDGDIGLAKQMHAVMFSLQHTIERSTGRTWEGIEAEGKAAVAYLTESEHEKLAEILGDLDEQRILREVEELLGDIFGGR